MNTLQSVEKGERGERGGEKGEVERKRVEKERD